MKKFKVSLCLVTVKAIKTGHIKKIIKNNKIWLEHREDDSEKRWRIELSNAHEKSIFDQIREIVLNLSVANLLAIEKQLKEIYFDIVVFHDTYTVSVDVSCECIKMISNFYSDAGILVTCYPTVMEDNEKAED